MPLPIGGLGGNWRALPRLVHCRFFQAASCFVMREEDRDDMWRKILHRAAQARGLTIPPDSIKMMPLAGIPCALLETGDHGVPRESAFALWLFQYLTGEKFSLVVFDPLSRFAGFDAEKDNATATRFVQIPERVANITGATVLTLRTTSRNGHAVASRSPLQPPVAQPHSWTATAGWRPFASTT